jgi:hypothetical protein
LSHTAIVGRPLPVNVAAGLRHESRFTTDPMTATMVRASTAARSRADTPAAERDDIPIPNGLPMSLSALVLCVLFVLVGLGFAAVMHHRDEPILGLAALVSMLGAAAFAIVYAGIESQ